MRVPRMMFTLAASVALAAMPVRASEPLSLQDCQRLQQRIDEYESLRRDGGSTASMDRWKRARRAAQEAFRRGNCKRYRYQLR